MRRPFCLTVFLFSFAMSLACSVGTSAPLTIYTNRNAYLQSLGSTAGAESFESYNFGVIGQGSTLGNFLYDYKPLETLPAIASDGSNGKLLGGAPYGVFVGGDHVSLTFRSPGGTPLSAFGADFSYAPSFSEVASNTYLITLQGGQGAGQVIGNPVLPGTGGTFFLGVIADPGAEFNGVTLSAFQTDTNTIVPALQVDNLAFSAWTITAPYFTSIQRNPPALTLQGAGGTPGGSFVLLSSPDVSLPLRQWSRIPGYFFDNSGHFTLSRTLANNTQQIFFALETQ